MKSQGTLDLTQRAEKNERDVGIALGHEAAERGAARANRLDPGWVDAAVSAFIDYAVLCGADPFLTIDARRFAVGRCGVAEPPDKRNWGGISLKLQSMGYLKNAGSAYPRHTHGARMSVWKWTGKRKDQQ